MCRLLAIRAAAPVALERWLEPFAARCRASGEYQGDGWGVSWWTGTGWRRRRSLRPIWDDELRGLPRATCFVVHARSAFRDDEVALRHNMPFLSGPLAFAFNGELRGVRLAVPGANGAARLFHLFQRFRASAPEDVPGALQRLDRVVSSRSDYVRALNLVVADGPAVYVHCRFSEDPDYFTLHRTGGGGAGYQGVEAVASEPFQPRGFETTWEPVANGSTVALDACRSPDPGGAVSLPASPASPNRPADPCSS